MKLARLTESDFNRIAPRLKRMGPEARAMAKAVLVEQRPLQEVADKHLVTKQRIHLAVEAFRKEYARGNDQCGWMSMELTLPHTLATELLSMSVALCANGGTEVQRAAIHRMERTISAAHRALKPTSPTQALGASCNEFNE